MKFRSIRRHLREALKNIFRNGWMTISSVGAVTTTLVLVAAFLAIILNLNNMTQALEDDVKIKAYIDLTVNEDQIKALGDEIEMLDDVDKVTFSSKEEELQKLIDDMGEDGGAWSLFKQDNPLNHAYIIKLKNPRKVGSVAKKIEGMQNVSDVSYGEKVVERLFTFNKYARYIGIALIAGLVLTAIFLISNTIKLTIMNRSEEIGIMKLVGATNHFIRMPFFIEGLFLGILGSAVPIAFVLGGYYFIETKVREKITYSFVDILPFNPFAWQLSLIILAIGIFIGVWGSVMSVRKFLRV